MLVSVYLATRNRQELLARAIDSVLAQTYSHVELVVADDASTDDTREYLRGLQDDGKLVCLHLPVSMGACVARNLAIASCRGEFITGLDDDDYFEPERIEKFISVWCALGEGERRSGIAGLFDSMVTLREDRRQIRHGQLRVSHRELLEQNLVGGFIFAPRAHYFEAGLYDTRMPAWQDWDLWVRISRRFGDFVNILSNTYVADESHVHGRISTRPAFMIRHARDLFEHQHGPLNRRQRSSLLLCCLHYPQVRPTLSDLVELALAGRLHFLATQIRRLMPRLS